MAAKAAAVKAKERRGKKNCRSLSVTDGLVVPEEGERRQESVCSRLLFFALEGLFGFPFFLPASLGAFIGRPFPLQSDLCFTPLGEF